MPEVRLIDANALFLKQKSHADLFKDSETHDDIVRRDEATMALAEILNTPTIEAKPEVQHGRWIKQHTDYGSKWNCSVCCISIRVGDGISFEIKRFAFCPFCGAQMDLRTPTEVQLDEADDVMMGGTDNG